jgi:Tissue inhibitor of metalloproteinase
MIATRFYDALVVGVPDHPTHEELAPMSRRPLAALASFVLAVLGVVFLLPPDCAYACSCAPSSIQRVLSSSEAVFSGEVVKVEEGPPLPDVGSSIRVTLRASEVWKGPQRETLEVSTPRQGSACGYPFKEGQEYLVFADEGKQGLEVNSCGRTQRLAEAQADLEVLGASKKPTGGEVLPDTSGDASVPALVGLVGGLALAASLLVVVRLVRIG